MFSMLDVKYYRRTMSFVGISYFLLMLFYFGATILITIVASIIDPALAQTQMLAMIVNAISLYAIATPLFLLILNRLIPFKIAPPQKLGFSAKQIFVFIIFMLGVAYSFNMITFFVQSMLTSLTGIEAQNIMEDMFEGDNLIWLFINACIVAPIGEEILFRKVLHQKIGHLGDVCYIVTSGVIFGLFHGNLSQLLYATALGMIFAYVYLRSGEIIIPICLHFIMNVFGSFFFPIFAEDAIISIFTSMFVIFAIAASLAIFVVALIQRKIKLRPPNMLLPFNAFFHGTFNMGMLVYIFIMLFMIAVSFLTIGM